MVGDDLGLLDDVDIATVAGGGVHDHPFLMGERGQRLNQGFQRRLVVPVVDDDRLLLALQHIEATGSDAGRTDEIGQSRTNLVDGEAKAPGGRAGGEDVLHLKTEFAAHCQGHLGKLGEHCFLATFGDHDLTLANECDGTPRGLVRGHHGMGGVDREVERLAFVLFAHRGNERIGRVQHGPAIRLQHFDNAPLHDRDLLGRVDVGHAEMVAAGDVRHHRDIAAVEPQAFAQDATPSRFEHGRIDLRIGEHHAGALGAAAVAGVDPPVIEVDAIGAGHPDGQSLLTQQVRDQPDRRRLAVGPRDGCHGNAAIIARGKEHFDDRFADGAGLTRRWLQVHAQAGAGIHLDDHAILFIQRAPDIFGHDIDSRDIEAHHAGRIDRAGGDRGMQIVGHIGGCSPRAEIGVAADDDPASRLEDRLGGQALL